MDMRPPYIDLLALPCAGGSANMYLRWRHMLPSWIRVVPVELPGRGVRISESFAPDIGQLVHRLCKEHAQSLSGRYALFGHSMGALLAHGMAQHQRAKDGVLPRALFVSASPSPARRDTRKYAGLINEVDLAEELRKQGGTPEEVLCHPELRRMAIDTLGADYRLCASHRYHAQPPLPMPIHAFGGRADELAASELADWRRETTGRMSVHWFDGGHFFIRQHEAAVLTLIVKELVQQFSGAGCAGCTDAAVVVA
jgi:surfactin synthase thioesterase subunit